MHFYYSFKFLVFFYLRQVSNVLIVFVCQILSKIAVKLVYKDKKQSITLGVQF